MPFREKLATGKVPPRRKMRKNHRIKSQNGRETKKKKKIRTNHKKKQKKMLTMDKRKRLKDPICWSSSNFNVTRKMLICCDFCRALLYYASRVYNNKCNSNLIIWIPRTYWGKSLKCQKLQSRNLLITNLSSSTFWWLFSRTTYLI